MSQRQPSLGAQCAGEVLGTFILVFCGLGSVHCAVTTGAYPGVLEVGLAWGIGVMLAAYTVGNLSGAHLNPAVTAALAIWDGFPRSRVIPYCAAQLLGAALAALVLHWIFAGTIAAYELREGITRGAEKSVITAAMYGEYFPNPTVGIHGPGEAGWKNLGIPAAFLAEVVGTAILALAVFACTDRKNAGAPLSNLAPLFIGFAVAVVIGVIGPLTQSCLNPARDFGPRFVAYFAGWGAIAFPGPRGAAATLLVYLLAPIVGAVLGGGVYTRLIRPPGSAS